MNLPAVQLVTPPSVPDTPMPGRVLEEFRPLSRSLEWRLSQAHWEGAGLLPFVENEVPFLINNNGRLSADAAQLFLTHCSESEPLPPGFSVLEIGAGTGLFARYFLDSFQAICEENGKDYYDRLTYIVTDRSERTAQQWNERALFENHRERVVTAAFNPAESPFPEGTRNLRAVICNYVLDVMPATVVRAGANGPEELSVRTHLPAEPAVLAQYTARTPDEIQALVGSTAAADTVELAALLPALEFEAAFLPIGEGSVPFLEEALELAEGAGKVLLNHGAFCALARFLDALDPQGFVLVNDYGPVQKDQINGHCGLQRFGPTVAFGIDFPLLEYDCTKRQIVISKPNGDDERGIHSRLISREELPRTRAVFAEVFSALAHTYYDGPLAQARDHAAAGRLHEALDAYREALRRDSRNWSLIGEAGEFLSLQLRTHEPALEMLRAALALNPCYSPWLWNALGDCLYCVERFPDAHEAYEQAARIDPADVRTNLNLAYTLAQFGRIPEALQAIARGLAGDTHETFRARLLDKQSQILALCSSRNAGTQERLARRASRMQAA
jgi:tetratricopeptide (TPR) repeat protein